jgi:hypothetical protein
MTERNERSINFHESLTLRRNRECRVNRFSRFDLSRLNHSREISQNQDKQSQSRDDHEKSIEMQRQESSKERDQREKRVKNSERLIQFVQIESVKRSVDQALNHHSRQQSRRQELRSTIQMTMQNIRKMMINVSINDSLFILYFHLNLDAKFEQYREHYAQTHEIVSNKSNSIKNINYAINRFLNICVNRSISKKSTLVMIVITFVSNSFFDKVQSNAQSEIKNVVIIIVKMCIICEKKYHTTSEHCEQLNLKRDRDQFDEDETIETANASEETTTTSTKSSFEDR